MAAVIGALNKFFIIFERMGIHLDTKRYSLAEYLEKEELSEGKNEFFSGRIIERTLFAPEHSLISANFLCALGNAAKDNHFRIFESSLMLQIKDLNVVLYADGSAFCSPLDQNPIHRNLVRNPDLIFEVGSSRFFTFRMTPSLQTYVLVEQHELCVHVAYRNKNGSWDFDDYFGLEAVVDLKPLGVSITMAEIYRSIEFN